MSESIQTKSHLDQIQRWSLLAGLGGLVLCVVAWIFNTTNFFYSYLAAFLFWFGIALGGLSISMLHHLTGGRWGYAIRRPLESVSRTLPLLLLLFLPILFGIHKLYDWSHAEEHLGPHQHAYLRTGFFVLRTFIYFSIWILFAFLINRSSQRQERNPTQPEAIRLRRLSSLGLVVYAFTLSFAAIDWVMSLEHTWYSTVVGMLFIAGQALVAFAFTIVVLAYLTQRQPSTLSVPPERFNDLGNLLLTFIILWAYLSFCQLLVTWMGNIKEEASWYVHRFEGGWKVIGISLILFNFFVPFSLLLGRNNKRNIRILAIIAGIVLLMRLVDLFWWVVPASTRNNPHILISWTYPVALITIGGLWLAFFIWHLQRRLAVALPHGAMEGAVHG